MERKSNMSDSSELITNDDAPGTAIAALDPDGGFQGLCASLRETGEKFGMGDITRIKMPLGGGTKWEIPSASGGKQAEAIEGVLVQYSPRMVLWGSENPEPGSSPVLVSSGPDWQNKGDHISEGPPEMEEEIEKHRLSDGTVDISEAGGFKYMQWGSGRGRGRYIREQRQMLVFPLDADMPYLMTASVGSAKVLGDWIKMLPRAVKEHDEEEAGETLVFDKERHRYWRCVVRFRLKQAKNSTGITYSKYDPSMIGVISYEDAVRLRKECEEIFGKAAVS